MAELSMWQTALVSLAVLLCACQTDKAPSAERVDSDVRAYIVKVQGRSDNRETGDLGASARRSPRVCKRRRGTPPRHKARQSRRP